MSERPNAIFAGLLAATAAVIVAAIAALAISGTCHLRSGLAFVVELLSGCVVFAHGLEQVPIGAPVAAALLLASLVGLARTLAAAGRERRLLGCLPSRRLEQGRLAAIASRAGSPNLYLLPARRPTAFSFGILRPRIVVSSALLEQLSPDEQAAVVWHEAHHVRNREPLKCLVVRLIAAAFFWLPLLIDLRDRYLLVKELAADRLAAEKAGAAALAGALAAATAPPATALGLSGFASARVERLFDPHAKLPPLFRPKRLLVTAVIVVGFVLLLVSSIRVDLTEPAHFIPLVAATVGLAAATHNGARVLLLGDAGGTSRRVGTSQAHRPALCASATIACRRSRFVTGPSE